MYRYTNTVIQRIYRDAATPYLEDLRDLQRSIIHLHALRAIVICQHDAQEKHKHTAQQQLATMRAHMCSSPINIDMLRNDICTFHKRTIHYVHWQYFLDMAEPLHFSLSMQQAKASLQKALQKALQDDDDDDEEEDDDHHLVLPDAKKEFIIKEMKDTTSQALHYLTKLRWNATVEGLDNTDQWHSEIANFLLSIFQQRCEETKRMATILRQASTFPDGVDARYPRHRKNCRQEARTMHRHTQGYPPHMVRSYASLPHKGAGCIR